MCLITEHARALKRLAELEASIGKEFWELFQPASVQQISFQDLYTTLRTLFPNASINLGENYRFLCSYDDIAVFLAQDQTNKMDYIGDANGISSYDCNVFANRLLGQFSVPGWADLTFGKVWLSQPAHALNCMLAQDDKFFYIEPQTDELLDYASYEAGSVRFIEM